jgi:hypothetical protein
MAEMRRKMAELKNALTKNTDTISPSNHIPAQVHEPPSNKPHKLHYRKITPEKDDELKQNQQKTTIILTLTKADDETKRCLKETAGTVTKILQEAIDKEYHDKTDVRP